MSSSSESSNSSEPKSVVSTTTVLDESTGRNSDDSNERANQEEVARLLAGLTVEPYRELSCLDIPDWFLIWMGDKSKEEKQNLATVLTVLKEKYVNLVNENLLKEARFLPHEAITNFLIITFCEIYLWTGETVTQLEKTAQIIRELASGSNSVIHVDSLSAFMYLYQTLETFRVSKLQKNSEDGSDQPRDMFLRCALKIKACCEMYQKLSEKAHVALRMAKALFFKAIRHDVNTEIEIMKAVMMEQPSHLEWRIIYFIRQRAIRRQTEKYSGPSEDEKRALLECLDINPSDLMVKLIASAFLSCCAKASKNQPQPYKVEVGPWRFTNKEDIMAHVSDLAKEIRMVLGHSSKINLLLHEFVTGNLPAKLRNYDLGKECLLAAIATNPNSSKANHQMAKCYIQERNFNEAENYIEAAIESDPRNFPAFMDRLHILSRNVPQNNHLIDEIYNDYVVNGQFTLKQVGSAEAQYGLVQFMKGDNKAALKHWFVASQKTPEEPELSLANLGNTTYRYQWRNGKELCAKLADFLENVRGADLDSDFVTNLHKISEKMKEKPPLKFKERDNGRNGFLKIRSESGPNFRGSGVFGRPSTTLHSTGRFPRQGQSQASGHSQTSAVEKMGEVFHSKNSKLRDPINPGPDAGRGFGVDQWRNMDSQTDAASPCSTLSSEARFPMFARGRGRGRARPRFNNSVE